ncbi:hypothetical protein BS78_K291200 [Paspalum vaginatum]|uniref:Uncharacterized protein n=1 Tax=Paspalum vaginatum TaxID=158149 RepID=A0A9W7X8F9_9POAL|nr:hypothetical protein BS78_K086700 [Paspalum vaginatum]KAJ1256839.1 hypothetical protein BS78_K291200 [Paspalum vaginatum]
MASHSGWATGLAVSRMLGSAQQLPVRCLPCLRHLPPPPPRKACSVGSPRCWGAHIPLLLHSAREANTDVSHGDIEKRQAEISREGLMAAMRIDGTPDFRFSWHTLSSS